MYFSFDERTFNYNLVWLKIVQSSEISVNRLHLICGWNEHLLQASKRKQCLLFLALNATSFVIQNCIVTFLTKLKEFAKYKC